MEAGKVHWLYPGKWDFQLIHACAMFLLKTSESLKKILHNNFHSRNLKFKHFFPLPHCLTITHTIVKRRHHRVDDSFESHEALDYSNEVVRFTATQTSSRLFLLSFCLTLAAVCSAMVSGG